MQEHACRLLGAAAAAGLAARVDAAGGRRAAERALAGSADAEVRAAAARLGALLGGGGAP